MLTISSSGIGALGDVPFAANLDPNLVPVLSKPVPRSKIKTVAQAADYTSAGFHVSVARGNAPGIDTKTRAAWASAAAKYRQLYDNLVIGAVSLSAVANYIVDADGAATLAVKQEAGLPPSSAPPSSAPSSAPQIISVVPAPAPSFAPTSTTPVVMVATPAPAPMITPGSLAPAPSILPKVIMGAGLLAAGLLLFLGVRGKRSSSANEDY